MIPLVFIAAATASAATPMGRAVIVMGDVRLERRGAPATLAAGDPVLVGDLVLTGADGRARVYLDNRSVVDVAPGSRLELKAIRPSDASRAVTVRLWLGQLWARVAGEATTESRFAVETSNAVAGVRGTSFFLDAPDETETTVTVEAGEVEVTRPGAEAVRLGTRERLRLSHAGAELERGLGREQLVALRTGHGARAALHRGSLEKRLDKLKGLRRHGAGKRLAGGRRRVLEKLRRGDRFHINLDPDADGSFRDRLRDLL